MDLQDGLLFPLLHEADGGGFAFEEADVGDVGVWDFELAGGLGEQKGAGVRLHPKHNQLCIADAEEQDSIGIH